MGERPSIGNLPHHASLDLRSSRSIEVCALFDAALAALLNEGSAYLLAGAEATPRGNRHPSIAPYQTYQAADPSFILAVGSDVQWVKVCTLIGRLDLAEDPELATNSQRVAYIDLVERELERTFEKRDASEWISRFREAGIPSGPVNSIAEAFTFATAAGGPSSSWRMGTSSSDRSGHLSRCPKHRWRSEVSLPVLVSTPTRFALGCSPTTRASRQHNQPSSEIRPESRHTESVSRDGPG